MKSILLIFLLAGCSTKEESYRYTKMYERHKIADCSFNCPFCIRDKQLDKNKNNR